MRTHSRTGTLRQRWAAATLSLAIAAGGTVTAAVAIGQPASAQTLGSGTLRTPGLWTSALGAPAVAARTARAKPPSAKAPVAKRVAVRGVGLAMYGRPASGLPWHSGFWTGGEMSTQRMAQAAAWVGHPFDFVTTYPAYGTWAELSDSDWAAGIFDGFGGRLSYGLPLLPANRRGHWSDVTSGAHDAVFRTIARQLVAHGRGDCVIRVGLEANGDWFPWAVTASTAGQYKAAFRRVVTVMRAQAPNLTFWFDTSAGFGLPGQSGRLDALTALYPGDSYVDGVSMDHYDFYQLSATSALRWNLALTPTRGAGLADAVAFARAHGKGFAVPEWGTHGTQGPGDNPFFIQKMHDFFVANRDVLVFECYFNEPAPYIHNALWGPVQMPRSSATYRRLF